MTASTPSVTRIILLQYLTLGIWFIIWCNRLGNRLSEALKTKAVPSLWWFIVPGGAYYWIWNMSKSLEIASGRLEKGADVFLFYLVFTLVPYSLFDVLNWGSRTDTKVVDTGALATLIGIMLLTIWFLAVTGHTLYLIFMQKRLNKLQSQN